MFLCADCYNEQLYSYTETPLSKVGTCDKCCEFKYVERVDKLIIKKPIQLELFNAENNE